MQSERRPALKKNSPGSSTTRTPSQKPFNNNSKANNKKNEKQKREMEEKSGSEATSN